MIQSLKHLRDQLRLPKSKYKDERKKNDRDTPKGIRTPVASVKGRCPRPLDDGGEATEQERFQAPFPLSGRYGSECPFVKARPGRGSSALTTPER